MSKTKLAIGITTVLCASAVGASMYRWVSSDLPPTWELLHALASRCASERDIPLADEAWFAAQAIADEWYEHSRSTRVVIREWEFRLVLDKKDIGTGEVLIASALFVGGEIDSEGVDLITRDVFVVAKPRTVVGRLRVVTGIYSDPGLGDGR